MPLFVPSLPGKQGAKWAERGGVVFFVALRGIDVSGDFG